MGPFFLVKIQVVKIACLRQNQLKLEKLSMLTP